MSSYTEEQLKFINYKGNESIILSATAGSGKTHSVVGRLNKMIEDGINPKRIIFFSFTNDAVNELRQRIKHDVKITTIHSFTSSLLGKFRLFKPIVTFYDFVKWYKIKYKPKANANIQIRRKYSQVIDKFYEDGGSISASFSAYKLQWADNIKTPKPKFYNEYQQYLKEVNGRDFADMLIDTERLTRNPKYFKKFIGLYQYVFVDEYQDTSTLQMKILLAMKAKQYHLIGDINQAIYGFSGANCKEIENLLTSKYETVTMQLSKNFRSCKTIVENANKFSNLKAIPVKVEDGYVGRKLITEHDMYDMFTDGKPLTVLVRTNSVIRSIEEHCLKHKVKMKYFNLLNDTDIKNIRENDINLTLKNKLQRLIPYYKNIDNLLNFIDENKDSDVFVTTIHKSKGREFDRCVVVNSVDPEMLPKDDPGYHEYTFIKEDGSIDEESRNVHYVAVTRAKKELYFLIKEF